MVAGRNNISTLLHPSPSNGCVASASLSMKIRSCPKVAATSPRKIAGNLISLALLPSSAISKFCNNWS